MKKFNRAAIVLMLLILAAGTLHVSARGYMPSPEQTADIEKTGLWKAGNKAAGTWRGETTADGKNESSGTFESSDGEAGTWTYDKKTKKGIWTTYSGKAGLWTVDKEGFVSPPSEDENAGIWQSADGRCGGWKIAETGSDGIYGKNSYFWLISALLFACLSAYYFMSAYRAKKKENTETATDADTANMSNKANKVYDASDGENPEKERNSKFILNLCIVFAIAAVVVCTAIAIHLHVSRERGYTDESSRDFVYEGTRYELRGDVETFLAIGLDKYQKEIRSSSLFNNAQADFILLFVVDDKAGKYKAVPIDRDTMAYTDILGKNSENMGTVRTWLALSHTYGTGGQDSMRNSERAVSRMLNGIRPDHTATFTLDAVEKANDLSGGVEVSITEDFPNGEFKKGEKIRLDGSRAVEFLRARHGMADPTNAGRMERQKIYLEAAFDAVRTKISGDDKFAETIVKNVFPYLTSDLTAAQSERLLSKLSGYEFAGFENIEGEYVEGEKYVEFYPDEDRLSKILIDLLYRPKKAGRRG